MRNFVISLALLSFAIFGLNMLWVSKSTAGANTGKPIEEAEEAKGISGGCTFLISPSSMMFPSGGGVGHIDVTAGKGCSWTVKSNVEWIWIKYTFGSGGDERGTVDYFVTQNIYPTARIGTLTIAGETFTATQACEEVKEKGKALSRAQKIAIVGGGIGAAAIGGGIAVAVNDGGGGSGTPVTTTTTTTTTTTPSSITTTTTTTTTAPSSIPVVTIPILLQIRTNPSFSSPQTGVSGGSITFSPNSGTVGTPVNISICFDTPVSLGNGWHIRVGVDNNPPKEWALCNTQGSCGLTCDLGPILKFDDTNHTVTFWVNLDKPVKFLERSLPLEFK